MDRIPALSSYLTKATIIGGSWRSLVRDSDSTIKRDGNMQKVS
jgi:hypothetical protein